MQARFTPTAVWSYLRATYWFVPSLMTLGALGLAFGLMAADQRWGRDVLPGWIVGAGSDGAREVLSAVAGSMITVVSVTFSVTIVALTVSAQHFGPRLLNNFMRDRSTQVVLGIFISTFAYCLLVLRNVQGEGDQYDQFIPHLAVTAAVLLSLISVGALIYYIHHIAVALQVSQIAKDVTRDLEQAIDRLYPEHLGRGEGSEEHIPAPPSAGVPVPFTSSGYIQQVEPGRVLELAQEKDVVVWLLVRPGDFATEGLPMAIVSPRPADVEAFTDALNGALVLGADRTEYQDPEFPVQQLVEVTLHALSTGINEPFTASTCIDRLGQAFARLATRRIPSPLRGDRNGVVRVIASRKSFADLLDSACNPIRAHAADSPGVLKQLLEVLVRLAQVAKRSEDQAAVARQAGLILATAERWRQDAAFDRHVQETYGRLQEALSRDPL